jgi:hypothetical protein
LLSITTGWPSSLDIFGANTLPRVSIAPPGGNPITIWIGLFGKFCAEGVQ